MNKFEKISKYIPAIYQPNVNTFIKALLEAWGVGCDDMEVAIGQGNDQLFVTKADGVYLNRLGSNVGVERPEFGMSDDDFRELVPILSFSPKQIRKTIYDTLEVFYGTYSVYSNIISAAEEYYALVDGYTISFKVDKEAEILITFKSSDFEDISNATALEVANAINKQTLNTSINAEEYIDYVSGKKYVIVRTLTAGTFGSIQVIGGYAQNVLQFPDVREITNGISTEWDLAIYSNDIIRLEWTGNGLEPDLSTVKIEDLLIISGPFDDSNKGTWIVRDVVIDATVDGVTPGKKYTGTYVEFLNAKATAEVIVQTSNLDVTFHYPYTAIITELPLPATLYEVNHKEVVVEIPSTSLVVSRGITGASHVHPNLSLEILGFSNRANLFPIMDETLTGMSALYMALGSGDFQVGDIITGVSSGKQATVKHIISNDLNNTILAVTNVTGGFILGEDMTAAPSGAVRKFTILKSTLGASARIDSVLDVEGNIAISNRKNNFIVGEALIGRTLFRGKESSGSFIEGEAVTTGNALHINKPWSGTFVVGETIQGTTSLETAIIDGIVTDKFNNNIVLRVSSVSGTFTSNESIQGLTSLATATFDFYVSASGTTANIDQVNYRSEIVSTGELTNLNGVFTENEIMVGAISGNQLVISNTYTLAMIYESLDTLSNWESHYIYNTERSYYATNIKTTVNQPISSGSTLKLLQCNVLPEDFPTSGYIVINYGLSTQEDPIKFTGKPNNITLNIDPSYVFKHEHSSGDTVQLISLEELEISKDGLDYPSYITGTGEALTALQEIIRALVAAGVVVRMIINYPKIRWECFNKVSDLQRGIIAPPLTTIISPDDTLWFIFKKIGSPGTPRPTYIDTDQGLGYGSIDALKFGGGKLNKL